MTVAVRSLVPFWLALASAVIPGRRACAQVPLGHAVVTTGGTTAPGLWLYEPLQARFAPIDASALPSGFQVSAVQVAGDGQRMLVAGVPNGAVHDIVLLTGLQGTALRPPLPFAGGLLGRTLALFAAPAIGQIVVVTDHGVFAIPLAGGAARPLTPTALAMGNHSGVLATPSSVLTSAVDGLGQAFLWRLDLLTQQLSSVQLRIAGRLLLGTGRLAGSVLLGEPGGQIWSLDLASLSRTPWVNLGRGPLRALWAYEDQLAWFAAVGSDIQRVGEGVLGPTVPVPGGGFAADIAYRAYESAVAAYGAACPGTASRLASSGWQGRPVPGNGAFALTVGNTRATTPVVLMVGAAQASIGLGFLGMPGCVLLTQPLVAITASTTAAGAAQLPLAIPPDPSLPGTRLFAQWLVVDPGANAAALVTSDALAVTI